MHMQKLGVGFTCEQFFQSRKKNLKETKIQAQPRRMEFSGKASSVAYLGHRYF
jgi:hypothetical protein